MSYRIVIPSYLRAEILKTHTLALLHKHNINMNNVDILLSTEEEGNEYKKVLGDDYTHNYIYHGQKGIGAVRNFIKHYYKYKTDCVNVVYIDDDIQELNDWDAPAEDLNAFFEAMFEITKKENLNLWGVSAFHNPFFMNKTITTNLKYISGCFCGEIIDREKHDIYTEFDHYEDFAFSCEHFLRDGGVVRNNGFCVITKYFAEGGIVASYWGLDKRKKDMELASHHFIERYGNMARIKIKKYGYDIRLNSYFKNE